MNTRLSSIGFKGETAQLFEWIDHAYRHLTERHATAAGDYAVWKSGTGIEWWTQLESDSLRFIDFQTHFAGKSSMAIRIVSAFQRPELGSMTGAFHAWVNPSDDGDSPGDFPIVFDAPDFYRHDLAGLPIECRVQLAAFPVSLDVFENEAVYEESQRERETKLASQALIPAGLFHVEEGKSPRSEAIFSGRVLEAYTRTNPVTNIEFISAVIETYGGTIDLITEINPETDRIKTGAIVLVEAVMTGAIDASPLAWA
ncbi:hypothetical protein [Prosthecobacter sp.]|uniref:hypothetical protein n=1 Tax=Prosthecobacter sp. TaxID=1965333 RepID=UPI0037832EF5